MLYAIKIFATLLALLFVAAIVFRTAVGDLQPIRDRARPWMLMALCLLIGTMSLSPPVFMAAIFAAGFVVARHAVDRGHGLVAAYLLMCISTPPVTWQIGGVGDIGYIIELTHYRALTLGFLAGGWIQLMASQPSGRSSLRWLDALVAAYSLLTLLRGLDDYSLTTSARQVLQLTLDVVLPYWLVSRLLITGEDFRSSALYVAAACGFAATIAAAEVVAGQLLVAPLQFIYQQKWLLTFGLTRDGLIRAQAMTNQPILLACLLLFGLGCWLWLVRSRAVTLKALPMTLLLLVGIWSTQARGPWLGGAVFLGCLLLARWLPRPALAATLLGAVGGAVLIRLLGLEMVVRDGLGALFGESSGDLGTIDYRRELLDTGLALLQQSPWLGVPGYANHMEHLRQGEGIIDLVNTYLAVSLDNGLIGLSLFLLPYVLAMGLLYTRLAPAQGHGRLVMGDFGTVLFCLFVGELFTIFTTSMYGILPYLLLFMLAMTRAWLGRPPEGEEAVPADRRAAVPKDHRMWSR